MPTSKSGGALLDEQFTEEERGFGLTHSILQPEFASRLREWARGRGVVGIAWGFRLRLRGGRIRLIIPDVGYVSYEDSRGLVGEDFDEPPRPSVAVEIVTLTDPKHHVEVLLKSGTPLVVVIDARSQEIEAHSVDRVCTFRRGESFEHDALPGFTVAVDELFDTTRRG